ncbi:MAG TPA: N-acetyltransferase [Candidatus Dormibacteraeota bacterium]
MSDEFYRLEARPLTDNDRVWLGVFSAGGHYWEQEVTDFLREEALDHSKAGYSTTTLYSLPGEPTIVGFLCISPESWTIKKMGKAFPNWEKIEGLPERIPIVLMVYFGVHAKHQGQGYGTEIFVRLLEDLATGPTSARFIYLQVWEDNAAAVSFYERFGFRTFDSEVKDRPDGHGTANLLKMAYDRFALPEEAD